MNNDGCQELFILSDSHVIYAIFSLVNDKPALVDAFWSRHWCVIDKTGKVYIHGSNGASDSSAASYHIVPNDAKLQLIEMVGIESYDYQTGESLSEPRYDRIQNGVKDIIESDEAFTAWSTFPITYPDNPTKEIGFTITPLA